MTSIRIGVVGDLHTHWDDIDVAQFGRSDYDLLFFIGDLGGGTADSSLRIARSIARLDKEALVMPGNNDTGDIAELSAELSHRMGLGRIAAMRNGTGAKAPIRLCGYSSHRITRDSLDLTLITARPHSMGGESLSFPEHMSMNYGIDSIDASIDRLCSLIDESETERLVFFSHNGPTGLGAAPDDMWGCDFKPGGGDWGDPDLEVAVGHAVASGKEVLAVVAGHMHLRTKDGAERTWITERAGIAYVNTARVPRIFASDDGVHRHHVSLVVTAEGVEINEVLVPQQAG
jgi:uncharacterized protein (TIGR04168 family)